MHEKKDKSTEPTYDDLTSFNDSIKRLIKLIRSQCRTGRQKETNQDYFKEQWRGCVRLIDYLLWRICLNRTENIELACLAVGQTRLSFIHKLKAHTEAKPFWKWAINEWRAWLVPFNVWLFIEAKRQIQELESSYQEFMIPPSSVSLAAEDLINAARRIADQPSPTQCPLRGYAERIKEKIGQQTAELRKQLSLGNCRRTCDLILLISCGFRMADVSLSLGVDKSWPAVKSYECKEQTGLQKNVASRSSNGIHVSGNRSQ